MNSDKDSHDRQPAAGHSRRSLLAAIAAGGVTAVTLTLPGDLEAKKKQKIWANETTFGQFGQTNKPNNGQGRFHAPFGIALSADTRTAWISDVNNVRISVWTRPNAKSTEWSNPTTFGSNGNGTNNFIGPVGVAVTSDGLTLLVADSGNHRISVWTRSTTSDNNWANPTTFGSQGSGPSNFVYPWGVAVTPNGLTALVADYMNNRISIWTRSVDPSAGWTHQTTFGSFGNDGTAPENLNKPMGLAVSANGRTVWVADTMNNRISVWTRPSSSSKEWSNQTTFGTSGNQTGQLDYPQSVTVSSNGLTALVADTGNQRISVWTRPSSRSTIWTNKTTYGTQGQDLENFSSPTSVATSPGGSTAWVVDAQNHRVSIWKKS